MYSNPFIVKLPLLRVANQADEENQKELNKISMRIDQEREQFNKQRDAQEEQEEIFQKQIQKNKHHPESSYTPHLFNFDHYYDPELTPRKAWQQKVVHLDSLLESQKQLQQDLEKKWDQERKQLSDEISKQREKISLLEEKNKNLDREKTQALKVRDENEQLYKNAYSEYQKERQRYKTETAEYSQKINTQDEMIHSKQRALDKANQDLNAVKDENNRLKNAIVNKDSETQTLKQLLDKEKERREAENGELRKLFHLEQEKCIKAVREAEQNSTRIETYRDTAERAERIIEQKEQKIEKLNQEVERLRKSQADIEITVAKRVGEEFKKWESQAADKSKSIEIRLNKREAENEKMEQLLIEMHKKMDYLKSEKDKAQDEANLVNKSFSRLERDYELGKQEQKSLRESWEKQFQILEKELQNKTTQLWKKETLINRLQDEVRQMVTEIERLRNVSKVGESVAKLPMSCFEDMKTDEKIKEIKDSALHKALRELGKSNPGKDMLVQEIEELEQKQKRAYMDLYKKMSREIQSNFDSKVDKLESEDKGKKKYEGKSANQIQEELNEKYKERMSEIGKENVSIEDLFRKYNI